MVRSLKRGAKCLFACMVICLFAVNAAFALEAETLKDAFESGTISGTIGSYYEYVKREADNADYGWATAYLTLKYETLSWKRLKMGARFFAHGQIFSHDDDGVTDPFDVDIESPFTLPELYLDYALTEGSHVTVGRWDHLKISHIDDSHSEGAYVQIKEIEDLNIVIGVMRRFAEIDYDDGEDFGRNNDSQDLDSEGTYGPGSAAQLYFLEATYQGIDKLTLNPFVMYHKGYASVYGMDSKVETKIEDADLTLGGTVNYYHVNADIAGRGDSNNYAVAPFVKKGPVYLTLGFAQFSGGNALNKPEWLRDYFFPADQLVTYGTSDSDVMFGKLKLTFGDFWTHVVVLDSNYAQTAGRGDGSQEYELQFGYKFKKNVDFNIRLFDVQYDHVDDKDYRKIETLVRFNF